MSVNANTLRERVSGAFVPIQEHGGVIVPTPVLYPSNGNVVLYVSGGVQTCVVSDRGDALRNARAHGVEIPNADAWLTYALRGSSLSASQGVITSGELKIDELSAGIALVARAASYAVTYALEHYKPPEISIQVRTLGSLVNRFGPSRVSREPTAFGASNRNYHFDFAVSGLGAKRLLVDAVLPNANSVNAKAIAHIDVGNLGDKAPLHAIVYDDASDWDASDINLLQSAAQLLPIGRLAGELDRYDRLH